MKLDPTKVLNYPDIPGSLLQVLLMFLGYNLGTKFVSAYQQKTPAGTTNLIQTGQQPANTTVIANKATVNSQEQQLTPEELAKAATGKI